MSGRWGKKYVDKRDWRSSDQNLVDRGAFFLDHSVLEKWKEGVDMLNEGKYVRQYEFPDGLIYWAAMQHAVLGMPYRQIEGYLKKYFEGTGLRVPDYTTLFRRIRALKFDLEICLEKKELVVAVDSTGIKVSHRGE
ncbi:hypothetical protein MCP_2548 [Methanocella paludicola SANAE]|uniref:Transposase DDE domain-containing protein n=1 Tax=Methanocella paludicola (strain DSM 17711 / JCM 13418 / NBRC 101707 / SANAE) TaxID=304371 RepID=D1Z1P8_METPS|nr:transposase [Methanocella paludicola]BAI62620.1 hypothetical protein MCP_2548 [Methanocella paludicola SANAE]